MTDVLGNPQSSTDTTATATTTLVINKCHNNDGIDVQRGGGGDDGESGGGIVCGIVEGDNEDNLHGGSAGLKDNMDGDILGTFNDGDPHDDEDDEVRNFFF